MFGTAYAQDAEWAEVLAKRTWFFQLPIAGSQLITA
jgi:hypothetical protein